MKIAVLYICTGKYSVFWSTFQRSCEEYFFPQSQKRYFVFSDTLAASEIKENTTLIEQARLGWPFDTLMRFHLFDNIRQRLVDFDYIFFCNANTVFKQEVSNEVLFAEGKRADLIVVQHPFFHWVSNPRDFPYERRKISKAFMNETTGNTYVMGGFNGGLAEKYLAMISELKSRIQNDYAQGIVARWHDESHLNKYIAETSEVVNVLPYNYGFPEGHDLPLQGDVFIEFSDKSKFGGHDFLRDTENSIPQVEAIKTTLQRKIWRRIRSLLN